MTFLVISWYVWDPKLGLSDIISLIAAILTLIAISISSNAARSAQKSAEIAKESTLYMKKQVELMEIDMTNTHSPKLLPIPTRVNVELSVRESEDPPTVDWDFTSYFSLNLSNVFQGNAYLVSAWLEISQQYIEDNYNHKSSSAKFFNQTNTTYKIITFFSEYSDDSNFYISFYSDQHKVIAEHDFPIRKQSYSQTPIVKQDEHVAIQIPSYLKPILIDMLYQFWEDETLLKGELSKIVDLKIKYKTSTQLETNTYTEKKIHFNFFRLFCFTY
ncbi:hypothetical protein [Exiguobacterium sp. NG55]|uniref:hypothetical protein n=1 Tax=Exiguobacterium sp. NG55 TaxID=375477 RepID=UPI0004DEDE48|nr:hypothetical protein [Exiguobacterium sp. NG55]